MTLVKINNCKGLNESLKDKLRSTKTKNVYYCFSENYCYQLFHYCYYLIFAERIFKLK